MKPFPLFFLELGIIPGSHQSMFFKKPIKYLKEYKIYGDYAACAGIYKESPQRFYTLTNLFQREPDGVSSKISFQKRKEKYQTVLKIFGVMGLLKSLIFSLFFRKYL